MSRYLRATLIVSCLLAGDVAQAQQARIVELGAPVPNLVNKATADRRYYYFSGVAESDIRVEVQVAYYTVDPDFGPCGGRSYGWPKPVSVILPVVFRPAPGRYGVLLSDRYDSSDDAKAKLCKWQMKDVVVRAYGSGYNDLLATVVFEQPHRAPYLYDPQPTPAVISLSCSRKPAPQHDWKARCSYDPIGKPGTHFLLTEEHSTLAANGAHSSEVHSPIQVNFRFND